MLSYSDSMLNPRLSLLTRYADVEHLLREFTAPKEGTEADADISNGDAGESGPTAAEKAEAERQYHLDNATPWWQQTHLDQ